MTQLTEALRGAITPEMIQVAEKERIEPEQLRDLIATGKAVLPKNVQRLTVTEAKKSVVASRYRAPPEYCTH